MPSGGCHCGAVRYTVEGEPAHAALCHCRDCTRCAGAQMVGWALFPREAVTISGATIGQVVQGDAAGGGQVVSSPEMGDQKKRR